MVQIKDEKAAVPDSAIPLVWNLASLYSFEYSLSQRLGIATHGVCSGFDFVLGGWLANSLESVVVAAHSNTWMVVLDPMKPGGPFEVLAQQTLGITNLTLRVHDVLFGDVWLCSGQSNMQMTVLQVIWRVSADNKC